MMVHTCHLNYEGDVNKRIVVQDSKGKTQGPIQK
jgi:hypothetical protein